MEWITDPNIWISLITLTILEIVLGVDNIIFISILSGKLPPEQQGKARTVGLMLALITRILLLCSIFWLSKLETDLFYVFGNGISGRDLVLLIGGLFLLWKSVHEIHGNLEGEEHETEVKGKVTYSSVITQIVIIDIVFSLDSVITAVGMTRNIAVMIAAVTLAMAVMLFAAKAISDFVNLHPTIKMLALSFLILVGVVLIAEGLGQHINKGYIYFAMAFSFGVEVLNINSRKKKDRAVELRRTPHA
ncbi:MAG TPA: TerC family protein [Chthoniobacteraceae bacterium]|jgi:predicted tellurium resistance membrane protein TerC|nr:Integral rane protein TerC [Chthoniobacter sp.]HEV7866951.1 TerC family protein [Chthoniobacteraceae bacterium]